MARTNKTRFAILGCLSIRPMSAYEIKQFISRSIAHFWTEGEGQLYPTLRNLAKDQLVVFQEQAAAKGGIKKIYTITKLGKAALSAWLKMKADRPVYRNELLLKLFFGSNQSTAANINLLKEAQRDNEATLDALRLIKNKLQQKSVSVARRPFVEISLDYGIEVLSVEIKWCQQAITNLRHLTIKEEK